MQTETDFRDVADKCLFELKEAIATHMRRLERDLCEKYSSDKLRFMEESWVNQPGKTYIILDREHGDVFSKDDRDNILWKRDAR